MVRLVEKAAGGVLQYAAHVVKEGQLLDMRYAYTYVF